jgi:hypothetical protein
MKHSGRNGKKEVNAPDLERCERLKTPKAIAASLIKAAEEAGIGIERVGGSYEDVTVGKWHLKPVLTLSESAGSSDALFMDQEARFWIGEYPLKKKPHHVSVRKAMDWYVEKSPGSRDGSGTDVFLVALAARLLALRQPDNDATKDITVTVNSNVYGLLTEAAMDHKCTVEEALRKFLTHTDALCEWSIHRFETD